MTDRELDALVAEKVFGVPDESPAALYSTQISAAWYVVERMRELGWYFEIDCGNASCTPHARFSVYGKGRGEASDLAPRAICLAALVALDVELPTPSSTDSE